MYNYSAIITHNYYIYIYMHVTITHILMVGNFAPSLCGQYMPALTRIHQYTGHLLILVLV